MIEIYAKSGILKKTPVVSIILSSSKYRWVKSFQWKEEVTKPFIEAIGLYYALKHIKSKFMKKDITVYVDSPYLMNALEKKDDKYVNNTKLEAMERLRNKIDSFHNITISEMPDNESAEELDHIYLECALDGIEIDEKD